MAGTDPSVNLPTGGSNSADFWMDLQVSDTAPAEYGGSYRLWPNKYDAAPETSPDSAVNYVVATEIHQAAEVLGYRPGAQRDHERPAGRPSLAGASPASIYQGSGTEAGQCTFAVGPPNQYPDLYVDGLAQNYWVDAEVTPATGPVSSPSPSGTPTSGRPPGNPPDSDAGGAFLVFFP